MPTQNSFWKDLTPEERSLIYLKRREREKKTRENWTNEQWEEYRNKRRNYAANWEAKLTVEQREACYQKMLEKRRLKWASMTSEEKLQEKKRHRERRENFNATQLEKERERGRQNVLKLKLDIVRHYTNGTMRCTNMKCEVPNGAGDIRSLCVDHINGGGKKHSEELKRQGINFYAWLKKQGYPSGFQVICQNCNIIKKIENKEDYRATTPFRRIYRRKPKEQKQ